MTTLYLVRHGEVDNPQGVIYGRLPGYGLSDTGRQQLQDAAAALEALAPYAALYASPLQRAQESAAIVAARLNLPVQTATEIMETDVSGYQGKPFASLPQPYITEAPTHAGIECAASIRKRFSAWVTATAARHPDQQFIAVSHRDPIALMLASWQGQDLTAARDLQLAPGSVHAVHLQPDGTVRVTPVRPG